MSSTCEAMKKSSVENNFNIFSWVNHHCSDMTFYSSANVFTNIYPLSYQFSHQFSMLIFKV